MSDFRQTSPCTWEWNGYRIVRQIAGFGMEVFTSHIDNLQTPKRTLAEAEQWCKEHALSAPIPETTCAEHCDQQR